MESTPAATDGSILDHFPLPTIRPKQSQALQFIAERVALGYRNIVVEAPTGLGKSAVGVCTALWSGGTTALAGEAGAYYLVTQKLLQDQLERDFRRYDHKHANACALLKSASEYTCDSYGNCEVGGRQKGSKFCAHRKKATCAYASAKNAFLLSKVGLTNYAYFFTERTYIGQFPARRVLVMDECHNIERQVLGFIDLSVDQESVTKWAPSLNTLPRFRSLVEFVTWVTQYYMPVLRDKHEFLQTEADMSPGNVTVQRDFKQVETHVGKLTKALADIAKNEDNWVFWTEDSDKGVAAYAKPIEAAPFTEDLVFKQGSLRLYLSAYIGPKDIFCRTVGLDPAQTVMASMSSTFPVENRPIHVIPSGSMSRRNISESLPVVLRRIEKIADRHANEKGLVHVHTYAIGNAVARHLRSTKHASRVLYAEKAGERNGLLRHHTASPEPTIFISPSITEGFSFDDDAARWQIIAKVPYMSLGDLQVKTKMERDRDWYTLQTVSTLLQAAGRIVRSDTDHGITYILDSDFTPLYERNERFFPKWLSKAFQFHKT